MGSQNQAVLDSPPSRQACVEILALRAFTRADEAGVEVTQKLVDEYLVEVGRHIPDCGCGICDLVGRAAPSKVFWTAACWQRSIARTRERAKVL